MSTPEENDLFVLESIKDQLVDIEVSTEFLRTQVAGNVIHLALDNTNASESLTNVAADLQDRVIGVTAEWLAALEDLSKAGIIELDDNGLPIRLSPSDIGRSALNGKSKKPKTRERSYPEPISVT